MSYDGLVTKAVAFELHQQLQGARIDKIFQPGKNEVCLVLRQPGRTFRLRLSTLAQEAAVYLSNQKENNPPQAPLFCMVLRKHLEGGRILSINQPALERIIEITSESLDELGDMVQRKIIVEIMGKHSNIILVEPRANRIIDAIKRITPAVSRYRLILPGQTYLPPPPQHKTDPLSCDADIFSALIMNCPLTQTISKALLASFAGMGPQTIAEIIFRSGLEPTLQIEYLGEYELTRLWLAFCNLAKDLNKNIFSAQVISDEEGKPITFSAVALTGFPLEMRLNFPSVNEALAFFYSHKRADNNYQQQKTALKGLLQKEIDRCEKKAALQLQTIHEKDESVHYHLWGKLLTANIYSLLPAPEVEVPNFYEPEAQPIRIPLDETLTIAENAQRYFRRFQKAHHAAQQAQNYYNETCEELTYLYSLFNALDIITDQSEITEIREEMIEAGYLKAQPLRKQKAEAQTASAPQRIVLANWEIYVGKNNRQNDLLVTKIAKPEDVWLHTKDIPGSHVIIKNPQNLQIPERILEQAAALAAFHSRARLAVNVAVDYTLKKHVRKQKGAKPGMVSYDNQRTIYITPQDEEIRALLAKTAPTP